MVRILGKYGCPPNLVQMVNFQVTHGNHFPKEHSLNYFVCYTLTIGSSYFHPGKKLKSDPLSSKNNLPNSDSKCTRQNHQKPIQNRSSISPPTWLFETTAVNNSNRLVSFHTTAY
mmetsp:Transcript_3842/g.4191  ORF Transcript_3842/g.4191 Transcript_3842/m.4191 type:complete len:115 (-) Transcript_3842:15-359(-)